MSDDKPKLEHSATNYNEHGHREVDQILLDAPTYKFVCGVTLCPMCGACCADYQMTKGQSKEKPKVEIDMNDPVEGKKQLGKYLSDVREKPDNGIYCATPMQITMKDGNPIPGHLIVVKTPKMLPTITHPLFEPFDTQLVPRWSNASQVLRRNDTELIVDGVWHPTCFENRKTDFESNN